MILTKTLNLQLVLTFDAILRSTSELQMRRRMFDPGNEKRQTCPNLTILTQLNGEVDHEII